MAQGCTSVGTGLNTKPGFAVAIANEISNLTGIEFKTAPNTFEVHASHNAIVKTSGALNVLAVSAMKIANDIRFLLGFLVADLVNLLHSISILEYDNVANPLTETVERLGLMAG
ncbi:hypothetical protein BY996DRAFT_6420409 [Phakopsora pachyrhizi]|nr:hypothetical protein BY996DRAFT_6420409 [Phakopsora pachyrhizi]